MSRHGVLTNVKDCGEKECKNNGKRLHSHKLNPRAKPLKDLEMTVVRAIELVKQFDEAQERLGEAIEIEPKQLRKVYGDAWYTQAEVKNIVELAKRYQDGSLFQQILEMAENLSPEARKRVKSDLTKIRRRLDS